MNKKTNKPRARALGLPLEGEPGMYNAITDVAGVWVGFETITHGKGRGDKPGVQTGVTAIIPRGNRPDPSYVHAGLHSFNGNGEMTGAHWLKDAGYFASPVCITNTHSVGVVHHGVIKWMIWRYPSFFTGKHRFLMPVVAETYDGILNDINGQHVTEDHVLTALNSARSGPVAEGNVGGGNGMLTYEFKGGTGTSSRIVNIEGEMFILGVLVQSNFGARRDLTICGVPIGQIMTEDMIRDRIAQKEFGSIIVVIATDAPLISTQLDRVARRATLGLARTGTIGGHNSGDIFLAFSIANDAVDLTNGPARKKVDILDDDCLDHFYRAARDAVEEAILNAMLAAQDSVSFRPKGIVAKAIDTERLMELMTRFGEFGHND